MLVFLLRIAGLAPKADGKTGKREAAWVWFLSAMGLTVLAWWTGEGMVTAMSPIIIGVWGFAAALAAGAYGLEWREVQKFMQGGGVGAGPHDVGDGTWQPPPDYHAPFPPTPPPPSHPDTTKVT